MELKTSCAGLAGRLSDKAEALEPGQCPLVPAARPHNGLLLGPGHISAPAPPVLPWQAHVSPGPGHRLSDPASPLVSFSLTWSRGHGEQVRDCGPRRPQKAASGEMEPRADAVRLGVCQVGLRSPSALATCAILGELPGLSEECSPSVTSKFS